MQINRLFEIVYILINKKQVTAKELAERFEVSTRTIYRDIESLCEAGIPIYTNKGKGGGISLLDNFVLNKSYLSSEEQQEVLTALQGLRVTPYMSQDDVLGKLSALFGKEEIEWINIDFGSWDDAEKTKFEAIKEAILLSKVIEFEYYNANMEKVKRKVNPLQLYFKDKNWYLNGYCHYRKEMRLFKLRRIKNLVCLEEEFNKHQYDMKQRMAETVSSKSSQRKGDIKWSFDPIKLWIEASQAYRVFDEFEESQIKRRDDGSFIVTFNYPKDEWLIGYLLSFIPYGKVLEPKELRDEMYKRIKSALMTYDSEE